MSGAVVVGAEQMLQQPVGEIFEVVDPLAQVVVGDLAIRAWMSSLTRCTAASAVSPVLIASPMRRSQPTSSAIIR